MNTTLPTAFARVGAFFHMTAFNFMERRAKLRKTTGCILSCETGDDGVHFVIDAKESGGSVQYTRSILEYKRDGTVNHRSNQNTLRDKQGYNSRVVIEPPVKGYKDCLIVGIVSDANGLPAFTFEAKGINGLWMISVDSYKYFS